MRKYLLIGSIVMTGAASATSALAGTISSACIASARANGDRALCDCIQQAADRTLTGAEQRRAAKFFKDPDEAQKVRMSRKAGDNEFWARYRAFGEMAEAFCAR